MTNKNQLQQELKEKVKVGVKPSDIKRLKRSKSDSDLAQIPAPPNPPNHLLSDQLKDKQKELEELRTKLEIANQALKETNQLLDNSLEARTKSLSDWTKQREQIKALSKELDDTVEQASYELNAGDDEVSKLRQKVYVLKSTKEQLERELKLSRINRNSPRQNINPSNHDHLLNPLKYFLYSCLAISFVLWLTNPSNIIINQND